MRGDALLYAASALLAAGMAAVTVYHGHWVWGLISTVAYAAATVVTLAAYRRGGADPADGDRAPAGAADRDREHRLRMRLAGAVFVVSALVPLGVLVVQRAHGVPWSAQPEVEVVERMARLLVDTGTPYAAVNTLSRFQDYAPYLPAMAVFGLPRAVLGDCWFTDVRLVFLVVAAALVLVTVRMPGMPRPLPVRAVQLAAVLPATTLTVATGGDDLPVLALLVLCVVCCHLGRAAGAGVAGGLALAMKLTAAPVLLVLAVAVRTTQGARRTATFAAIAIAVAAAPVLPVAAVSPAELVEHVISFPAGLTGVQSPAASPLPGYLLAQNGPLGRLAALALLAFAAIAIAMWVLRRPPAGAPQAAERAAAGLVAAMLLMPATRFGYLVYPLVLAGTAVALRATSSWSGSPRRAPAA